MAYLSNVLESDKKIYIEEGLSHSTPEKVAFQLTRLCGIKGPASPRIMPEDDIAYRILSSYVKPGDHIICSPYESTQTKAALMKLKEEGVEVSICQVNPYGTIKVPAVEALIKENTTLLVCAHSCYVTGNSTDLEHISAAARKHGIKVASDVSCSLGAIEIDAFECGMDAMWGVFDKFFLGPDGVCMAYSRDDIWTSVDDENAAQISQEAIDQIGSCLDLILENDTYGFYMLPHRLAKRFFESTKAMRGVTIYGDFGPEKRLPIVLLTATQKTTDEIVQFMEINGFICEKVTAPWLNDREMVQFSFGYYNNRREVTDAEYVFMTFLGLDDFYLLS